MDADTEEVEKLITSNDDAADEDDFFLRGPSSKKTVRFASDKLKDVRVQIAEVTDVMRDNVGRLLERGDQLDHLQDRSEGLATTSDQFRSSAGRLHRRAWWENMRGRLCIAAVAVLLFLVIFIPVTIKSLSS